MGLGDKIENAAEKAGGKGKEAAGAATGDESLRTEARPTRPKAICSKTARKSRTPSKRTDQTTAKDALSERGASFCLPRTEMNQERRTPFPPCQPAGQGRWLTPTGRENAFAEIGYPLPGRPSARGHTVDSGAGGAP
jgi:hypothetical protein